MSGLIHATAVAYDGRAAILRGVSGSGKSSLALQLVALGCSLIADDQVMVVEDDGTLLASRPETLPARLEARGVGLLKVPFSGPAKVRLIVDLDQLELERHPGQWHDTIEGVRLPLLRKVDAPHFPATIFLYLRDNLESL